MTAAASHTVVPKGRLSRQALLFSYISITPAVLLVGAISFLPLAYALVQSLHKSDYLQLGQFVGFANYYEFLFGPDATRRIWSSFYFVVGTVTIATPLGLGFALLLNQPIKFRAVFRTILIIPWLVSALVGALLWTWMINPSFSPLISSLEAVLGVRLPSLLTSFDLAMPALIVAHAWAAYPMIMIFCLAALQTVPIDLMEAARIDGANAWQRFSRVIFPYIKNTILVSLVLTTLNTFNHVTLLLVMTGGGPVGSTETMALRVFLEGFRFYRMGTASAGAVVIFGINIIFALIYARILRDRART